MNERNPQAEQMGDASMARNLAYQAEAIWPQERVLFDRYALGAAPRILDLGCGTGEITRRLAERYRDAELVGVDILESNLAIARDASAGLGARVRYEHGDAFALAYPDAHFDLVVCRHLSQAVPDFPRVFDEITRVLRPGGWLHLLSEDYGMLHLPRASRDADRFWIDTVFPYLDGLGCDSRVGRHSAPLFERAGYAGIAADYVVVDTLRVPRAAFAGILRSWRDGYASVLADASGRDIDDVRADFDAMVASIDNPARYAVWHVPVISGRRA
ncbi:MAG TPA: methyltransferase domain-containing protein [Tahibacter sp.]|nr:methyltransferase domain-containing protein [Tahibacter sp.]